MRTVILGLATAILGGTLVAAQVSNQQSDRVQASADVLHAMHQEPDHDIPSDLWQKARCVLVVPSLKKAAFVFGGEYGRGLMACRTGGGWSAPVFMELEKGSWGFQIGGESIDLVLLVMNDSGMKKMLQDKVSLGADASVAAGPVGRNAAASTDAQMSAEILSYSRAQGIFAGIDISGGVLKPDGDANRSLYGHEITPREILTSGISAPATVQPFLDALHR